MARTNNNNDFLKKDKDDTRASNTPEDQSQTGSSPSHSRAATPEGPTLDAPPLPDEALPPLPNELPPQEDDGWAPVWDPTAQAYYFYNRFTNKTQWENPRIPEASSSLAAATSPPGLGAYDRVPPAPGTAFSSSIGAPGTSSSSPPPPRRVAGGYNPAIHGDYDPNADYALEAQAEAEAHETAASALAGVGGQPNGADAYAATGTFNRFTGRWQAATLNPENFNDENKSRRQMNAFFDVDAAANSHDGRSLKAERAGKKLSKKEVKAFRDKRREKKEEKRRAWLRD